MVKQKYSFDQKLQASKDYLSGLKGATDIALELGMSKTGRRTIRRWAAAYQAHGWEVFHPEVRDRGYSLAQKVQAVESYLNGEGSMDEICLRYKILSRRTLLGWIRKYNSNEDLHDSHPKTEEEAAMAKKTTERERLKIVKYCLSHEKNYKRTAEKFGVSYGQVYSWTKKYGIRGAAGLADKRGHHKSDAEVDETERLRRENNRLKLELDRRDKIVELVKKKMEFERRLF